MRKFLSVLALSFAAMSSLPAHGENIQLQSNAPDRYTVVKGDTLWHISGKFLKKPWLWPRIWGLNKDTIKNPHWIYPGDIIVLYRSGPEPRLSVIQSGSHGLPVVKISPEEHITPIENAAIPTIPMSAIQPFLSQPRVVEKGGLDHAPFILGTNQERMILGEGDDVYATGGPAGVKRWNILRMGPPLKDPVSGEVLGYEVKYLGDARTIREGAPQKLLITRSVEEIKPGDKLEPAQSVNVFEYVPSAPAKPVDGRIIAAYGGFAEPARYQTVVVDLGRRNGLVPGNVLAIYRTGAAVKLSSAQRKNLAWVGGPEGGAKPKDGAWLESDIRCLASTGHVSWSSSPSQDAFRNTCLTTSSPGDSVQLPDARSGLLMVYEVFDKVSYGLILDADGPVYLLDTVKNP